MICPTCERPTYKAVRVGNKHVRPTNCPEGALLAALLDGTCYRCHRVQRGIRTPSGRRREPIIRHKMTEDDIQRVNREYQRYTARRRTRGVPREGLHPSTLVRPGLFLMEVR